LHKQRFLAAEQNFDFVLNFIRIKKAAPVAFLATEHKFDFAAGNRQQATGQRPKAKGNRKQKLFKLFKLLSLLQDFGR
jgi:hypothetical protein